VPKAYDPARNDLQLRIVDDDEVLALTIPAGTRLGRATRVALDRPAGAFAKVARHGRDLRLVTEPIDLARADRDDHMVTVSLAGGTWRASHTRLWVATGDRLMPGGR